MVNYRRYKSGNPDDVYFLTIVTQDRTPRFTSQNEFTILTSVMKRIHSRFEIKLKAWVFLPEHMHILIKPGSSDYSKVVLSLKKGVSLEFKKLGRITTGEKLWQDRFWEETIRDEDHYNNCVDYIHFNPVKHGYVERCRDWPWSSFHRFVREGYYDIDWGVDTKLEGAGE